MKITIRKTFRFTFLTMIFLTNVSLASAQSNWQEGRYYQYQGGSDITCGNTFVYTNTDGWNYWNEGWQYCRKRVWHKEYRSGYVYLWSQEGWYREWKEGYFWYFNWYDFSRRVW